jgi:hypothetical protein
MDGKIQADDFNTMIRRVKTQLAGLKEQQRQLSINKEQLASDIKKKVSVGLNLNSLYSSDSLRDKVWIIGSTFPRNFIFEKNKFRTSDINKVLLWIMKNNRQLQKTITAQPNEII